MPDDTRDLRIAARSRRAGSAAAQLHRPTAAPLSLAALRQPRRLVSSASTAVSAPGHRPTDPRRPGGTSATPSSRDGHRVPRARRRVGPRSSATHPGVGRGRLRVARNVPAPARDAPRGRVPAGRAVRSPRTSPSGYDGHPCASRFRDVDAAARRRSRRRRWRSGTADVTGDYSAFTDNGGGKDEGEGTTFLRGSQTTGDDEHRSSSAHGQSPSWVDRSGAVHSHLRVHSPTTRRARSTTQRCSVSKPTSWRRSTSEGPVPSTTASRTRRTSPTSIAGDPAADGTLLGGCADGATTRRPGSVGLLDLGVPTPSAVSTGRRRSDDGHGRRRTGRSFLDDLFDFD